MEPFRAGIDLSDNCPLPARWRHLPHLRSVESVGDLAKLIGRFDDQSDTVLDWLLSLPLDDPLVAPAILLGVSRLIFLCRGRDRELLNDLVVEVAIAIGEMRRVRPVRAQRRIGYVIVDRARDRQRAALRRDLNTSTLDPDVFGWTMPAVQVDVDETVTNRVVLDELRERVVSSGDHSLMRSWNTVLDMVDSPRASQAERDRWKYVRSALRKRLSQELVA